MVVPPTPPSADPPSELDRHHPKPVPVQCGRLSRGHTPASRGQIGLAMIPLNEVREAVATRSAPLPEVLTLDEAAVLLRIAPSTLKKRVCRGELKDCVRRGRPLLFWRDRLLREGMRDAK